MKFVLFTNSDTQRVTAQIQPTSVLITKEYRKSVTEDWKVGKGITIPVEKLVFLGKLLESKHNETEFIRLLSDYEIIREETT